MMSGTERVYRFGSFAIEGQNGLLYQGRELVSLLPKVAQTLFILVEHHGKVVDKEFLLKSLWPDSSVEEGNLHHNVSALRKLLRSDGAAHIETIPKRGYRFVGEVSILDSSIEKPLATQQPSETPEPPLDVEAPQPGLAHSRWSLYLAGGVVAILCVALLGFVLWPRPKTVTVAKGTNTIAVLPFSNFTSDSEADYLSDGLTDELIHALTAIPNLRVVGRTSTFQFKGKGLDLRRIGAQLQAGLVLEGSVQKDGNRLRVTAQLIDAGTGLHIWSLRFDRQFGDVFAIQDEICRAIERTLRANLSSPEGFAGNAQKAANLEVYTLYLRGLKE